MPKTSRRYVSSRVSIFSLLFVMAICGCGQQLPENMPKLHSCSVKVVMNGVPVSDAVVSLTPPSGQWYANGLTDSNGTVNLKTQGKYSGVAAGTYKGLVAKIVSSDPNWTPKSEGEKAPPEIFLVDPLFFDSSLTPLSCEVKEGVNEFRFEVASPKP